MRSGTRLLAFLAVALLVVVGIAVVMAIALPVAVAVVLGLLALVGGIATQLGQGARRVRRGPHGPGDVEPPGPRWTTEWEFVPPADAVPYVRDRLAVALADWGVPGEAGEPALLVVTELLSNAAEHGHGPMRLTVELHASTVRVEMYDSAPEPPRLQPLDPRRVRGRGLQLVKALSARWGWSKDPPGKVVWADVLIGWPT